MSHRIRNRGSNGLPKLVQTYAPSILFPVRYPAIGPGTVSASNQKWDVGSWKSEVRNVNSEARNEN